MITITHVPAPQTLRTPWLHHWEDTSLGISYYSSDGGIPWLCASRTNAYFPELVTACFSPNEKFKIAVSDERPAFIGAFRGEPMRIHFYVSRTSGLVRVGPGFWRGFFHPRRFCYLDFLPFEVEEIITDTLWIHRAKKLWAWIEYPVSYLS